MILDMSCCFISTIKHIVNGGGTFTSFSFKTVDYSSIFMDINKYNGYFYRGGTVVADRCV